MLTSGQRGQSNFLQLFTFIMYRIIVLYDVLWYVLRKKSWSEDPGRRREEKKNFIFIISVIEK
jgi:hypothetical protein